ncbi:DUF3618 domain-containing protein [Amycolatopsis acidiphila]|uniref:DUF3618 domain-containing protein n=1 Tax=Amycolatopsis acidiphila TaxID=715473 RepID=A0A557ZZR2_9PSEU|nr:DUF3618 domain-containing protein [Amycolatopsis acidiphila]TVT17487.1 DUF3618 domain-containing protein [Amycolatopsis acidiphila]UIJ62203.1 DUF3618 domain-containing protein [Amycolatopsis acidiphila]GHG92570.1 hypothetical protein GCM10017788_69410 [Amycolatopsis acidiphila]
MSKRETFPRDVEEARLDAELTRQELGETAEALAEKVKDTAHTTQRAALTTGAAIGAGLLLVLIIRRIIGGR